MALGRFMMVTLLTLSIVQRREKASAIFQFKVKPTERAKTEDDQTTYNWFVILNPHQDLKFVNAEFKKTEKDPVKPVNFEPGHSSFDTDTM